MLCRWFPGSSDVPAGYVKCFHVKHVLWSQWNVQSGFQMKSCVMWELCCFCCCRNTCSAAEIQHVCRTVPAVRAKVSTWKHSVFLLIHWAHYLSFKDSACSVSAFYRPMIKSSWEGKKKPNNSFTRGGLADADQVSNLSLSQNAARLLSQCHFQKTPQLVHVMKGPHRLCSREWIWGHVWTPGADGR